MTLAEYYVIEEKFVKSVTGEIVPDLQPRNIEKLFHLLRTNQYLHISYDGVDRWYRENEKETKELVQTSFLIDNTLVGQRVGKVDMQPWDEE